MEMGGKFCIKYLIQMQRQLMRTEIFRGQLMPSTDSSVESFRMRRYLNGEKVAKTDIEISLVKGPTDPLKRREFPHEKVLSTFLDKKKSAHTYRDASSKGCDCVFSL